MTHADKIEKALIIILGGAGVSQEIGDNGELLHEHIDLAASPELFKDALQALKEYRAWKEGQNDDELIKSLNVWRTIFEKSNLGLLNLARDDFEDLPALLEAAISRLSNPKPQPTNPNKAHIKDSFLQWYDKDIGETVLIPLSAIPSELIDLGRKDLFA